MLLSKAWQKSYNKMQWKAKCRCRKQQQQNLKSIKTLEKKRLRKALEITFTLYRGKAEALFSSPSWDILNAEKK